jgi:hypothetical protein
MTSSNYGMEEENGYLVPNRTNNNTQKDLAVDDGYLVPTSPGFQVILYFSPKNFRTQIGSSSCYLSCVQ